MPELYYFPDATCGIRARLALLEKGVAFDARVLDRFAGDLQTPQYLKLNPKGVVPTLVHDGAVLVESAIICLYVDDAFAGAPLRPDRPLDRSRMYLWMKNVDESYFPAIGALTFGTAMRTRLLAQHDTPDKVEAYLQTIRIADRRERTRDYLARGLDSPLVQAGVRTLDGMLGEMERALERDEFLAGPRYSLADASVVPYLLRLQVLGLDGMWSARPRVSGWWERMRARTAFRQVLDESFSDRYFADMLAAARDPWPSVRALLHDGVPAAEGR
jgi:glutathione S-transferase